MGNRSTKSTLRNAFVMLNISADEIKLNDDKFWCQIWNEDADVAAEVIKGIRVQEIRMLRDGSPKNFAYLTYKMVELLHRATGTLCNTQSQQTAVIIAARVLTRLIPCIFEDNDWEEYFIINKLLSETSKTELKFPIKKEKNFSSYLPTNIKQSELSEGSKTANCHQSQVISPTNLVEASLLNFEGESSDKDREKDSINMSANESNEIYNNSLISLLTTSICDLLFCPEFTVLPRNDNSLMSNAVDAPPVDLKSLTSCDYVWEPGVGFDSTSNSTTYYDKTRTVLLKLLLTTQSEILYLNPNYLTNHRNFWNVTLVSSLNRHVLPLFTTLLNTIFVYNPTKMIAFNKILFEDYREELVELCIQILIASLDHQTDSNGSNLFIEYLSRIHRTEDFDFLIRGFVKLLNSCFEQSYLLSSSNHINFNQELLILFWKLSNTNSKFINHLLKTNNILDIVVPILHYLNESFQDTTKTALIHTAVFNLLILSGERNFGVKLNKTYSSNVLAKLPTFSGSHADLLIIVFHKLILYGYNLNQLFDYMLTVVVNISPYLKALSVLACKCLIQLFEIFSSPLVVFTEPKYHRLVLFLLEIFNNIIQYQFDGNTNLVYVVLKHKEAFLNISNLPCSKNYIDKILKKLRKRKNLVESNKAQNDSGNNAGISSPNNLKKPFDSSQQGACERRVSLTLVPNISQVTQSIRPSEVCSDQPSTPLADTPQGRPRISLDDIIGSSSFKFEEEELFPGLSPEFNDVDEGTMESAENSDQVNYGCVDEDNVDNHRQERWRIRPEWIREWKKTLPLHTIIRMIEVLSPQLDRFKEDNKHQNETELIRFLQNGTLVGLLPVPHPILIRKYQTNEATTLWFKACTWTIIYVRQGIWTDTATKLIKLMQ